MPLTPEYASAWLPILYDIVSILIAAFMLIYATILNGDANPLIIAGGLSLLGAPPLRRLIVQGRQRGGEE